MSDKFLALFVYVTTIVTAVGCIVLIAEDGFDIYALWNIVTLGVACYLISKE